MKNVIICVGVYQLVTYDLCDVIRREEVKMFWDFFFAWTFFFYQSLYRHIMRAKIVSEANRFVQFLK